MKKTVQAAFTLMVMILSVAGCSRKQDSVSTDTTAVAVIKGAAVETVQNTAVPELLEVVGTVRARTSAAVSARIPGSINLLKVREGDRVKKGQLLAQLDARENQATAAAASAVIDEARRGLDEALSRKKLADSTFERYHNLYSEQAISRQEFDVKQAEKEMAAQGAARAEARLRQAQEGANAASAMSDYTKIIAPISGIISSKQADLGATVFPGQHLMTIEDEGTYQLELSLPENMAAKVKSGTPLQVTLDSVGSSFSARITETVPTADPASRTFIAKVALTQPGLKSGMFGRGSISLGSGTNGILIAKKAVIEKGALTSVWTVDKGNVARMRIVKTGRMIGEGLEILSGLSDGDRVVTNGVEKVSEGAKVE